jgi:hypothetical protein
VIRIELDKDKVAAKRVQLEDLQRIIVDVFGQGTFQIIISDQNMPRQVRCPCRRCCCYYCLSWDRGRGC